MNQVSVLKFFSTNAMKSEQLETELVVLRRELKQVTTDTSEEQLNTMQRTIDALDKEARALRAVNLNFITTSSFKALPHITLNQLSPKQEFEQRKALILKCSDITEEKFNNLHAPDFLKLYEDICDLILKASDDIQGEKLDGQSFEFALLHPFENETGQKFERIKFQVPKVVHSQALADIEDEDEREDFMFRVVTGLTKEDFNFLSLNDYLALKPQVGAFFQQSAGYFRPTMLNL
ncbi:phage tail assembly protein [Vibrio fluvialis]|nr:phage tail assembly protein [Vibrio fluvialis]MBY7938597.1 phage tail assembly protein [Vibrio fluvialis]